MRKKIQTLLFFVLIITDTAVGKSNKAKSNKIYHKEHNSSIKEEIDNVRIKRSVSDDDETPFWPNRGKKQIDDIPEYYSTKGFNQKDIASNEHDVDDPFRGYRGKRDPSFLDSTFLDYDYPEAILKTCEYCKPRFDEYKTSDEIKQDLATYWGNRGKRNNFQMEDLPGPFWGNRGRRNDNEPTVKTTIRLGTENEPFWGNRGRREEEPFWGNRGRREEKLQNKHNLGKKQDQEPFWGNRGRKSESDPFWGNRGRRQDNDPFWGNRGRRQDVPFWGNRGRRRQSEKPAQAEKFARRDSILAAMYDIEKNIESLSMLKRKDPNSFWASRGRLNKFSVLFNGPPSRSKLLLPHSDRTFDEKNSEPGTVLDNRMYVDEPNYILVERSGRSSGEEDPYYISRGKKYYLNYSLKQAARDRRGAIEEIVKSVRNDPYYIARGKKDIFLKNANSTLLKDEYMKVKYMICSAIDLILAKNEGVRDKREITDNERDRRTTLKKLAAQLQADPYFVSRGKKDNIAGDKDYLEEFISNIAEKCN